MEHPYKFSSMCFSDSSDEPVTPLEQEKNPKGHHEDSQPLGEGSQFSLCCSAFCLEHDSSEKSMFYGLWKWIHVQPSMNACMCGADKRERREEPNFSSINLLPSHAERSFKASIFMSLLEFLACGPWFLLHHTTSDSFDETSRVEWWKDSYRYEGRHITYYLPKLVPPGAARSKLAKMRNISSSFRARLLYWAQHHWKNSE